MLPATEVFALYERDEVQSVCRHEVFSASFGALRRSLRGIVFRLAEIDDQAARELSAHFRACLSEWLTVPTPFGNNILEALEALGTSGVIQNRWGADIRALYNIVLASACTIAAEPNPLRICLQNIFHDIRGSAKSFKIYCHRSSVPHFQSLLSSDGGASLPANTFLHSIRDYRESSIFDVLIKVGPLRARGWGAAPDAVRSAPRFTTLIQLVWSGCSDDPDFGYDPGSSFTPSVDTPQTGSATTGDALSHRISWVSRVERFGFDADPVMSTQIDEDDLRLLAPLTRPVPGSRHCVLLQVDDKHGILFPPSARIVSFDPSVLGNDAICQRLPGDSLSEDMYVVRFLVDDIDLTGVRAEHGHYSRIWKFRLQEEFRSNPAILESRLRAAGLNLIHLDSAINHWCNDPTTVIHAPQQMRHFEVLISVLECDINIPNTARVPWWRLAWEEIRRSRGEAIQAGVQEHEVIEEQMIAVLRGLLPQIRTKALEENDFQLEIPSGNSTAGMFLFLRVSGIEDGFVAPESEIKVVRELNSFEQWRV